MNHELRCLRIASCMAPNADRMCRAIVALLGRELAIPVHWIDDVPWHEREGMLDRGEIDLCWICGLPYVDKADRGAAIAACVAPVMHHPRHGGTAVYFSDVVVRADSHVRTFADLRGKSWAYNEPRSHSGFNLVRYHLASQGLRWNFFGEVVEAGSHQAALEMILAGATAGAAIDSSVLEAEVRARTRMTDEIRVVHTLGPSPSPPWVVSTQMPARWRARVTDCLASLHCSLEGKSILNSWGIARLQPVDDACYEPIRHMARIALGIDAAERARGCRDRSGSGDDDRFPGRDEYRRPESSEATRFRTSLRRNA
ncbi:MAG: PhnD/SsuA/transferrin family substrate-binding protein [Betaproteobacteria bacterium]|nr:PhnD/SsuA/transferrin family substrate-binding protein [Betaproteobacteria bacterium]